MPTIIYSPSSQPRQVDDFPADCERTVKGALHVRPGSTCVVSDGEAAHLKASGVQFAAVAQPRPSARKAPPALPAKERQGPDMGRLPSAPLDGAEGFDEGK